MKTEIYTKSRRDFIQKLALSSAVLTVLPQFSFGKENKKGLKIGILEISSDKAQTFSHLLAVQGTAYLCELKTYQNIDILYIPNFSTLSLDLVEEAANNNIHLMVEKPKDSFFPENDIILICQNAGVLLAVVEDIHFDRKNQKVFNKTDLYESAFAPNKNIKRSLDFIKLLELFTEKNNFNIHQSETQTPFIV